MTDLRDTMKPFSGSRSAGPCSSRLGRLKRTLGFLGRHMHSIGKETFHWVAQNVMTMSAYDFLSEWFETDVLIAAMAQVGYHRHHAGHQIPRYGLRFAALLIWVKWMVRHPPGPPRWAVTGGVSAAIAKTSAKSSGAEYPLEFTMSRG